MRVVFWGRLPGPFMAKSEPRNERRGRWAVFQFGLKWASRESARTTRKRLKCHVQSVCSERFPQTGHASLERALR